MLTSHVPSARPDGDRRAALRRRLRDRHDLQDLPEARRAYIYIYIERERCIRDR